MYENVQSDFIHNIQKVEKILMSISKKWINKLWYVHKMEYYKTIKRINYDTCNNVDESK